MSGQARVSALYRHPVKGFTPEAMERVELVAGECFPNDRLYAVENGPSGFDANLPVHISKQKFTVLARKAEIARLKSRFDDKTGMLAVEIPGEGAGRFDLRDPHGREDFAHFLSSVTGDLFDGPLRVLEGPGAHRFMDHHKGAVSLLNLGSVAAFEEWLCQPVSALRFRMNIHIGGLEAFAEDGWQVGDRFRLGGAVLELVTRTVRCKATHANPMTGEYDLDLVPKLFEAFGRNTMGVYFQIAESGIVQIGDQLEPV